jgi:hypothetical protein
VTRRPYIATLTGFGLAAVLAACSSGPASTSASTSSSTSANGPAQNVAADRALAAAANLKLSDFPTGWTSNPSQNSVDANEKQLNEQLSSCLHISLALFKANDPASADSPEFDDSNGDTAQSSIDYQASESQLQTMISVVQGARFPSCMTATIKSLITNEFAHPSNPSSTLPAGATVGNVTFSPMSFPTYGDASSAFRMTVPISYRGLNFSGYFDIVFVKKGRAAISTQFFGSETPFDSSMEQQLTGLVVERTQPS